MRLPVLTSRPNCRALLAALAWIVAGSAGADEQGGDYLVRSWQSEDGLPGNVLRSVTQAADGYLWVTSAEGVVRFDGLQFSGFEEEPDATLARLPMRGLFPMPNGDVWIATVRGGLLRWHAGRLRVVLADVEDVSRLPQNASVTQVVSDPDAGVVAFRGTEVWQVGNGEPPRQLKGTEALEQRRQADSAAWSARGRVMLSGESPSLVDRRGHRWTLSNSAGLIIGDDRGMEKAVTLPINEAGLRVAELCEDREGTIWVATGESGLIQVRERRVNVLSPAGGLSDRTAFAVLQDRNGTWWVGNKSGGVDRITDGRVTHVSVGEGGSNRPVSTLFEDRSGTLWAATLNGSVFRFEDGAFQPAFAGADGPSKISAIGEDSKGGVWFGGPQGVVLWADGAFTRIRLGGALASDVSALAIDAEDVVWIGMDRGQVFRGRAEAFTMVDRGDQFPMRAISSFHIDTDGSVWITSLGGGLALWRGERLIRFSTAAGLPDPRLTAVLDDHAGHLWLGSLGGVFRVAKTELEAIVRRQATSANWLRLDRADGLLSRECTGVFQPAAWRASDGELWFPTVNGIARIRPDRLALNPLPPPIVIEACSENGNRLPLSSVNLRAGPGRPRLDFHYSGLSLAAAEKVRFRVRLEGLESEWRDAGALRVATYEAVPPGHYRFQVIGANADGVWNPTGATLAIEVLPHFWETGTFRALVALAAASAAAVAGWAIARERMKRRLIALELRHAREAERSRIARDLHDDLGASLTEISMLADVTAEETPSASARRPLEEIASRAHALIGALDEIVWAVNPRHDTLASLADYLAATAGDFLATAGLSLRLDVPRDLSDCEVDAERRHTLLLAVREALHNVVKHANARAVWLRLKATPQWLEIIVEDDGHGFDSSSERPGDGLTNLRERLHAIGGECHLESSAGLGTRVTLRVSLPAGASPSVPTHGRDILAPAHS